VDVVATEGIEVADLHPEGILVAVHQEDEAVDVVATEGIEVADLHPEGMGTRTDTHENNFASETYASDGQSWMVAAMSGSLSSVTIKCFTPSVVTVLQLTTTTHF